MKCLKCGAELIWHNFGCTNAPIMKETDWLIDVHNHLNLARHELLQREPNVNTDEADRLMSLAMEKVDMVITMLREKK